MAEGFESFRPSPKQPTTFVRMKNSIWFTCYHAAVVLVAAMAGRALRQTRAGRAKGALGRAGRWWRPAQPYNGVMVRRHVATEPVGGRRVDVLMELVLVGV